MKKNKKLFAILTLVAFMMTLMPVMAFAADEDLPKVEKIDVIDRVGYVEFRVTLDKPAPANYNLKLTLEGVSTDEIELTTTAPQISIGAANRSVDFTGTVPTGSRYVSFYANNVNNNGSSAGFEKVTGISATVNNQSALAPNAKVPSAQEIKDAAGQAEQAVNPSKNAGIVATADTNVEVAAEDGATETNIIKGDDNTVELQIQVLGANTRPITGARTVYIWVEDTRVNQASDALVLSTSLAEDYTTIEKQAKSGVYKITTTGAATNDTITVYAQFLRAGSYTLHGSIDSRLDDNHANTVNTFGGINQWSLANVNADRKTIKVTEPSGLTDEWGVAVSYVNKTVAEGHADRNINLNTKPTATDDYTWEDYNESIKGVDHLLKDGGRLGYIQALADTVAVTPVTLRVYDEQGRAVRNRTIELSTNSANIELSKTSIVTDFSGNATFDVAGVREGIYRIYVTIGEYEAQLFVKVGATSANLIETIKFPSNPIATDTDVEDYKNIFRFLLTDANGNIVATTGKTRGAEKATDPDCLGDNKKYVTLSKAPEANKVKDADLYLYRVPNKDYYTLKVINGKKFEAEGDYEVRIVLDNGKSVTVPFTVKKFDKAVSLHIEYPTEAIELDAQTDAPDIYFLDANGVTKKAEKRVTVAATGYAVANVNYGGEVGVIKVKNDEKYLGQTITVSAVAEKENLVATTTLTVTDSAQSIKLDSNRGQVNANNRIGFKLVNSNGQAVALGNDTTVDEVTCIVTNVENPDAKVSFSIGGSTKSDLKATGTGTVMLSSNKETVATVQIMVKVTKKETRDGQQDNNTGLSTTYYTGTETFTFGAEADKSVVMTIGSKEIVANNVPATIDVAPFIRDNRTFVPFRALVEAFGAEVAYDEATSTVTTKLDGKTVVLTVGSTVLTVNDETVTMDVAPYIVDDRVVVPVRFVGEAFGFTVEATQDAETGATASVVFYQK